MIAVVVWHMVLAIWSLEDGCNGRFKPVHDGGVISVRSC